MAVKFAAGAIFLLLSTSIFSIAMANKNWISRGGFWGSWQKNVTDQSSKTIVVGGPENSWHYGFNYSDWANNNGPFYVNDIIVFKYDAPNTTQPFQHSVYSLPNLRSYLNCDLARATKIADVMDGGGDGVKVVLAWKNLKWPMQQTYYFACGEHNGAHCNGGMKFAVLPIWRPRW